MKYIRWSLSWSCYYVGLSVQWVMERAGWWWLCPAFNKFMCWSDDLQPSANFGPWRSVEFQTGGLNK